MTFLVLTWESLKIVIFGQLNLKIDTSTEKLRFMLSLNSEFDCSIIIVIIIFLQMRRQEGEWGK